MARTIAQIQTEMDNEQALQTGLSGLTSTSQVAIYTLWKYIMSSCIWTHETLWDLFKVEIETIVNNAPVGTEKWVQSEIFKFQYDTMTPQVVGLVDFVPAYPVVDDALKIITRCSVKTQPNRIVKVKVAKGTTPTALNGTELSSLIGYLTDISFAGVQYNVTSQEADKLLIGGKIYYNGQYASVIQTNVIAALDAYMASLPFDGFVRISGIEDAIQSVAGVNDLMLQVVQLRGDTIGLGLGTDLVYNATEFFYRYPTISGYVVQETTSGSTFTDTLTFIPQ